MLLPSLFLMNPPAKQGMSLTPAAARSAAVNTPMTPGARFASAVLIDLITA